MWELSGFGKEAARARLSEDWTDDRRLPILLTVTFRDRLVATIQAARPIVELPEILIIGSEVPNLLQPGAAATLVVSLDLDIGVPVQCHAAVRERTSELVEFTQSEDEPSVWTPRSPHLLEVNFDGMDANQDPADAYVLEDDRLPLLVAPISTSWTRCIDG